MSEVVEISTRSTKALSTKTLSTNVDGVNDVLQIEDEKVDESEEEKMKKIAAQRLKMLGVTEDEMKRWAALKRLGLGFDDFEKGCEIMSEQAQPENKKEEKLTGYTMQQIKRAKAVNMLGTSEQEVDDDRAKKLSSLGFDSQGSAEIS
jgi:hypothetical protein